MKRNIAFPKIGQFRNVISTVSHMARYVGQDEHGDPIYDDALPKPVVNFTGTVKLHGTNASVAFNSIDGVWAQSRKNVINVNNDNAGFALFVEGNKDVIMKMINDIVIENNIDSSTHTVVIYGEWCGSGIQKNIAISQLPKMWVLFGVKISSNEDTNEEHAYWVEHKNLKSTDNQIFNISDFKKYEVTIDFNQPDAAQNEIVELVKEVECCCPVGKTLGANSELSMIGEGIVFTGSYKDNLLRFKSKGQLHSGKRPVKTLSPVDLAKKVLDIEFANETVTQERLQQGWQEIFGINNEKAEPTIKKMGDFLKWLSHDILEEELDLLIERKLEPKKVKKHIAGIGKNWFVSMLNAEAGL